MFADYHVHSEFSDDSREPMEDQIKRGIELGLDEICFTDHVDYGIKLDWDDPAGIEWRGGDGMSYSSDEMDPLANVNYPEYFGKLLRMRATYGKQITIKAGLEFGIQSITVKEFEKLFEKYRKELDFVLFSMHQVDSLEFWTQDFQKGKTQKEYNRIYYEEILRTVKAYKNYSVLGHLDAFNRYDPQGECPLSDFEDLIRAILENPWLLKTPIVRNGNQMTIGYQPEVWAGWQ